MLLFNASACLFISNKNPETKYCKIEVVVIDLSNVLFNGSFTQFVSSGQQIFKFDCQPRSFYFIHGPLVCSAPLKTSRPIKSSSPITSIFNLCKYTENFYSKFKAFFSLETMSSQNTNRISLKSRPQ